MLRYPSESYYFTHMEFKWTETIWGKKSLDFMPTCDSYLMYQLSTFNAYFPISNHIQLFTLSCRLSADPRRQPLAGIGWDVKSVMSGTRYHLLGRLYIHFTNKHHLTITAKSHGYVVMLHQFGIHLTYMFICVLSFLLKFLQAQTLWITSANIQNLRWSVCRWRWMKWFAQQTLPSTFTNSTPSLNPASSS